MGIGNQEEIVVVDDLEMRAAFEANDYKSDAPSIGVKKIMEKIFGKSNQKKWGYERIEWLLRQIWSTLLTIQCRSNKILIFFSLFNSYGNTLLLALKSQ